MNGYAKGGDITSALAKLAKLLSKGSEEAVPAVEKASQYAVVKPDGSVFGAPFDYRVSANHIAENLNQKLPGHSVQEIPADLSTLSKYTPSAPAAEAPQLSPDDVNRLMTESGGGTYKPGMAEGGSFDPIASAAERVRGQSSPGSPGVSGAVKDAVDALKGYLAGSRQEFGQEADKSRMSQIEDHADGGTTGVSTEHEQKPAGLAKRFGVRVAEQAYGLDSEGNPALGGRAWTQGQGGTPMGFLDEMAAIPHNMLSLMHTTRSLDPIRKHLPGNEEGQAAEDSFFNSVDPQWSKDAAGRLDRLRSSMNREYSVGEAHTFPEHLTDAAASLVSPVPMAAEGKEAGAAGRLLEMTVPLRPRTLKNAATDSVILGGTSTGIDNLTQRLQSLRAQAQPQGGGQADPEQFSHDMGVQPEESRDIHNNHDMIPLVGEDGHVVFGVDPQTFGVGGMVGMAPINYSSQLGGGAPQATPPPMPAGVAPMAGGMNFSPMTPHAAPPQAMQRMQMPIQQRVPMMRGPMTMRRAAGGMVKPPTRNFKPPVLGHVQSPLGQAIQNKGNAGRYAGGMGLAPARPPRIPVQGMFRNIDQGLKDKKSQLLALGGSLGQPDQQNQGQGPDQGQSKDHIHQVVETALGHLNGMDISSAAAVLRSSPEAMSHPDIAAVENALRNATGITPATKTLNQLSQAGSESAAPQMQHLLPPLQSPGGGQPPGAAQPPGASGMPPGPQGSAGPSRPQSNNIGAPQPPLGSPG